MHGALAVAGGERRGSVRTGRKRKPSRPVLDTALAAVISGGTPDVSSDDTLGTVTVHDPWELQQYLDGKTGRPPVRVKIVNLRDDPLGRLHARDQVDEAQYAAGRQWQRDYEHAEISNLRAIDFTRDVVDGGKPADPMSDHRSKAMAALARYDRALGLDGSALVRQILGQRMFIKDVAKARGFAEQQRMVDYFSRRFRECLETLAREMGLVTKRR